MAKREGYRYCPIEETKCGKCKHLKYDMTWIPPYYCDVHKEPLPKNVVEFFADGCAEFEPR